MTVKLSLSGTNPAEWLALRAGIVPAAAAEAWGGMALSGVLIAAVRTGVTERLARQPSTAADLAADLGLDPVPTRLLLDCLRSAGPRHPPGRALPAQPLVAPVAGPRFRDIGRTIRGGHRRLLGLVVGAGRGGP